MPTDRERPGLRAASRCTLRAARITRAVDLGCRPCRQGQGARNSTLGTPMAQVECQCAHFTPGRVCASASVWCANRPGFIGATWARPVRHGCGLGVYGPGFALVGGWVCSGAALRYRSVEIGWLHPEELCELDVHLAELQRPVSAAPWATGAPCGHCVIRCDSTTSVFGRRSDGAERTELSAVPHAPQLSACEGQWRASL